MERALAGDPPPLPAAESAEVIALVEGDDAALPEKPPPPDLVQSRLTHWARALRADKVARWLPHASEAARSATLAALPPEGGEDAGGIAALVAASGREDVLEALRADGSLLAFQEDFRKNDKNLVLAAVTQNGWALRHAPRPLRDDREIVRAAVTQNGWALQFAGDAARDDWMIVRAAVAQNGWAMMCASSGKQEVSELVEAAMSNRTRALPKDWKPLGLGARLRFALETFQNNRDFGDETDVKILIGQIPLDDEFLYDAAVTEYDLRYDRDADSRKETR